MVTEQNIWVVIGVGLPSLFTFVGMVVSWLLARSTREVSNEAGKASAADSIASAATKLVTDLQEELVICRAKIDTLEKDFRSYRIEMRRGVGILSAQIKELGGIPAWVPNGIDEQRKKEDGD